MMKKEMAIYVLAEQMIREATEKGTQLLNIRCHPTERFLPDHGEFFDILEESEDSPIKLRNRDWVLGISIREKGRDSPYMSLPPSLLLPLLTIFSEKTIAKNKRGFAMYNENSRKTLEKFFDVTLYLESDSSISIGFEEIGS